MRNENIPEFVSHKKVRAFKIGAIERNVLVPEDPAVVSYTVTDEYMAKHKPQVGGYFILYGDGYTSWSPAEAFESGYTRV